LDFMWRELMVKQAFQLRNSLEQLRSRFGDPGDKGSVAEEIVRAFLLGYLPRSYGVGHGEIVDSAGGRSGQLDLVATGPDHPATYESGGGPGSFLIEAVTAVAQIKAVLTSDELASATANCESVKRLTPTMEGVGASWESEYNAPFAQGIPPFFLFAFGSQLTLGTIAERAAPMDGVFLLDRGVALRSIPGGWPMLSDERHVEVDWVVDEQPDQVLAVLLAWLSLVMPHHDFRVSPLLPYITRNA
jgi:hypothetical protein